MSKSNQNGFIFAQGTAGRTSSTAAATRPGAGQAREGPLPMSCSCPAPSLCQEQCRQPQRCASRYSCSTPFHKSLSSLNVPMVNKHKD